MRLGRAAAALGIWALAASFAFADPAPSDGGQTLTIDSAKEAGLIAVEAPGEGKILRLSGGLQVTLVDKDKKVTHKVTADELWYDQAHEEMTARGHVVYTMTRASSTEVFRGESLTFRLSDSQGVFYDGASDRPRTVSGKTLTFRYAGSAIRRSSEDMVVMNAGVITSSLGTDPHYRILAKTIWVLAPGEWGLQDAVLYLGRIPVLYFPFFFQPGDDFFFNPVLSFPDTGDRRGTSLQTTTYFWGKKTKDAAAFSFLQLDDSTGTNDERVRRGLYLVRGKDPDAAAIPSGWVLKLQADMYSNLGFLSALNLSAPGALQWKSLTGLVGFGITRTVGSTGLPYSVNPFQAALDPWAQSDWNGSNFFGLRLPFRWGGNFAAATDQFNLSLEGYSDPYLYADLTASRSENFSVFQLLGLSGTKTAVTSATAKSTLTWTSAYNAAPVTAAASLLWASKALTTGLGPDGDPENQFYYPSQLILPQVTLTLAGSLWPWSFNPTAATPVPGTTPAANSGAAKPPAAAKTPAVVLQSPDQSDPAPTESAPASPETPAADAVTLLAPDRFDAAATTDKSGDWTNTATWTLQPTGKTDTRFDTSLTQPTDGAWNVLSSRWSGSYDGKLNLASGWSDGTWNVSEGFALHQQAQQIFYQGSGMSNTTYASEQATDAQQTSALLTQTLGANWKPFATGGAWRESSVQYSLGSRLWQQTSTGTTWQDWSKNTVTAHSATAQAVVYLIDGTPSLKASASGTSTIDPLDLLRTWTGSLAYAGGPLTASTTATAKQTTSSVTWDPWETKADWKPFDNVLLSEDFQWDLGNQQPLLSTSLASAYGFSVQYRQQQTTPYKFDTSSRLWVVNGAQAFLPQELRLAYNLDVPAWRSWYDRSSLTAKVGASWPINLQKYSDMPLSLTYTLGYSLAKFVDLQFSGGVQNKTAFRYFPALTQTFGAGAVSWVNPLADLWDSVSIWDRAALQRTGFKMTTLSLSLTHYLDDWQVKLDYSGAPTLNTAGTAYQWQGTMTLLVSWYPIPELKNQLNVDKDGNLTIAKSGS